MAPLRQRRIASIAALTLTLGLTACFNPAGGGGGGSSTSSATSTAPEASTSDPGTPTTSLPGATETSSGSTSDASSDATSRPTTSTDPGTTGDGTTGLDMCGNGVIDPGEGCDPGVLRDAVGCGQDCQRSGRFVFVTIETIAGADVGVGEGLALCNQVGPQFSGLPPISYMVWLSEANSSASTRIDESDLPFIRVDGTIVAENRDAFVMGPHLAPINMTPNGMEIGSAAPDCSDIGTLVWTGTEANGEWAAETCTNWSVSDPMIYGALGTLHQSDARWTRTCTLNCATLARVYCVENP